MQPATNNLNMKTNKNLILTMLIMLTIQMSVLSQPCLPEGITFTTQSQIDSFQINYPNCTEIEGQVVITGNDISNLNGLNVISLIWDTLIIFSCNNLTSLTGLANLTIIGGDLRIYNNNSLNTLSGLDNVFAIESNLVIIDNDAMQDLSGLGNLEFIAGGLYIFDNENLTTLDGIDNLAAIEGELAIGFDDPANMGNPSLTNITGLSSLTSTNGYLFIAGNESLTSLTGLENIYSGTIDFLYICNNSSLSSCSLENFCEFLTDPFADIIVENNAPGCNTPEEVIESCEGICLAGGTFFSSQEEIDSFPVYHPNCIEIAGNVTISGDNISNLDSLYNLTINWGYLEISANPLLTNLSGLDNMISTGGALFISNNETLIDISSLENLLEINGNLYVLNNTSLESLAGFTNVEFIGGHLKISNNPNLIEIGGLDNIIYIWGNFEIHNNDNLENLTGATFIHTILGSLKITENDLLTNLAGMDNINTLWGGVEIKGNTSLTSLTGINSLTNINGNVLIENNENLENLSGLEGLSAISGSLVIGSIGGNGNASLTSLTSLSNLESIGSFLIICGNESLNTLWGLHSLDPESIAHLVLINNSVLSECEVQSVCEYLVSPNGYIEIYDNATGCNSPEEVMEACFTSTMENDIKTKEILTIVTNPCSETLNLKIKVDKPGMVNCDLYEVSGIRIKRIMNEPKKPGTYEMEFKVGNFPAGVYFCTLKTNDNIQTKKLIIK